MDKISLINKLSQILFSKKLEEPKKSIARTNLSVNSIINDQLIEEISSNYTFAELEFVDEFVLRRIYLYLVMNERITPEIEKPQGKFQNKIKAERAQDKYSAKSL